MFQDPRQRPLPRWHESLDPALVARLRRPLVAPGVISIAMARRVFGWVAFFENRRSLLSDLQRRRARPAGAEIERVPIVHARWAGDVAEARERLAQRTEPTGAQERAVVAVHPQESPAPAERPALTPLGPAPVAAESQAAERSNSPAPRGSARAGERQKAERAGASTPDPERSSSPVPRGAARAGGDESARVIVGARTIAVERTAGDRIAALVHPTSARSPIVTPTPRTHRRAAGPRPAPVEGAGGKPPLRIARGGGRPVLRNAPGTHVDVLPLLAAPEASLPTPAVPEIRSISRRPMAPETGPSSSAPPAPETCASSSTPPAPETGASSSAPHASVLEALRRPLAIVAPHASRRRMETRRTVVHATRREDPAALPAQLSPARERPRVAPSRRAPSGDRASRGNEPLPHAGARADGSPFGSGPVASPEIRTWSFPARGGATPAPSGSPSAAGPGAGAGAVLPIVSATALGPAFNAVSTTGDEPAAGAVSSPAGAPPAPAAAGPARVRGEVNLDVLADKVQRKLLRRLAAEQERKGGLR